MRRFLDKIVVVTILVGIGVSIWFGYQGGRKRDRETREASIAACLRQTERAAIAAAAWRQAAETRRVGGDTVAAERYEAVSAGLIDTISAPPKWDNHPKLAQVETRLVDGVETLHLTKFALSLHLQGCRLVYPHP